MSAVGFATIRTVFTKRICLFVLVHIKPSPAAVSFMLEVTESDTRLDNEIIYMFRGGGGGLRRIW